MLKVKLIKELTATNRIIYLIFLIAFANALLSCENDDNADTINPDFTFNYSFQSGSEGWIGDFADYPDDEGVEEFYELEFTHSTLPEPLNTTEGALKQSGNNRSDDLFMFVKRKVTGLEPNQTYALDIEIEFATNAASGAAGIGGPPGEAVYLKAGASAIEPNKELDTSDNHFRMNIDKGNQSQDGNDMKNMGDFANGTDDFVYTLKSLQNTASVLATTNAEGELWVIVGTDSGFEGTTTIYYNKINISFSESDNN